MDTQNLGRAALQGLSLGWGDEGEAWLRSKLGEDYDEALKQIKKEYGKYSKDNPGTSTVAELAGGFLPGVLTGGATTGASTAGTLARMGGLGALTGGVAGAGAAEEGDRLSGGASGAVLGTALGVGIPAVMRGASGASAWLRDRLNPSDSVVASRAAEKMLAAMDESGVAPRQLLSTAQEDAARKIPSVVANADNSLSDLAEAVAQRTGKGARKIEETLVAQRLGSKERAYEQTTKALKPGNYYDDLQSLQDEMKTLAGPAYTQAYSHGVVTDPKVLDFMKLPQFQQGAAEAQKLLAAEGRTVDMTKPTVEVLDQVKRGLDALIEKETDNITGKTTSLGRVYTQKKNEFLKALDAAVPDYELARGIYAGGAELKDAMNKGLNQFKTMDHEQVAKMVAGMKDPEKQAFRTGVARDIYSKIMDPSGNFNAAQRVFGSPETQQKLRPLFNNDSEFKLFKAAMERESQLFNQSNKILGGSQTGKRMQMRDALEDGSGIGEAIGHAVTGGFKQGLTGMVMGALRKGQMTEKTASKLADMLMAKDPHEVAAVVKLLESHAAAAGPKALRATANQAGAVTGATGAIFPAPSAGVQAVDPLTIEDEAKKSRGDSRSVIEADLEE